MAWWSWRSRRVLDRPNAYTGPPLTDSMVAHAEVTLGYRLPRSYIEVLRHRNGGAPRRQCYPTSGTDWSDNHIRVNVLFGIGGDWGIDVDERGRGSRNLIRQGFPEVGVLIAWTTVGEHAILLDYSECGPEGEPRVVLANIEEPGLEVLAPDFATFVRNLVSCRSYDRATERAMEAWRQRQRDRT